MFFTESMLIRPPLKASPKLPVTLFHVGDLDTATTFAVWCGGVV